MRPFLALALLLQACSPAPTLAPLPSSPPELRVFGEARAVSAVEEWLLSGDLGFANRPPIVRVRVNGGRTQGQLFFWIPAGKPEDYWERGNAALLYDCSRWVPASFAGPIEVCAAPFTAGPADWPWVLAQFRAIAAGLDSLQPPPPDTTAQVTVGCTDNFKWHLTHRTRTSVRFFEVPDRFGCPYGTREAAELEGAGWQVMAKLESAALSPSRR